MPKAKLSRTPSHHHVGMFNAVEMSIISQFIRGTDLDDQVREECGARGLMPQKLNEPLVIAKFLSRTILAAQAAQRVYGVPASVLISMALHESSWEAASLLKSAGDAVEWPGCECCYSPEIQQWFFTRAKLLISRKYSAALSLVADVKAYVSKICSIGLLDKFGSKIDGGDILSPIENYDLEECDLAGWLAPGEYRNPMHSRSWSDDLAIKERNARCSVAPAA